jgi:hypothetical protein
MELILWVWLEGSAHAPCPHYRRPRYPHLPSRGLPCLPVPRFGHTTLVDSTAGRFLPPSWASPPILLYLALPIPSLSPSPPTHHAIMSRKPRITAAHTQPQASTLHLCNRRWSSSRLGLLISSWIIVCFDVWLDWACGGTDKRVPCFCVAAGEKVRNRVELLGQHGAGGHGQCCRREEPRPRVSLS